MQECTPLLELATRQGLLQPDRHAQLKANLEEIARMLSGRINGLDRRARARRARMACCDDPTDLAQMTSESGCR